MNPIDILTYGQREIDGLIDRLGPDDWTAVALGSWSTKDLVGHLGAFEVRFVEILTVLLGDEPSTSLTRDPLETFNDDQAALRVDWPVERIVAELRDAFAAAMSLVPRIPPERWREAGTVGWYGPQYSLDDLVVYLIYGHKREHAPQIDAVLSRTVA